MFKGRGYAQACVTLMHLSESISINQSEWLELAGKRTFRMQTFFTKLAFAENEIIVAKRTHFLPKLAKHMLPKYPNCRHLLQNNK